MPRHHFQLLGTTCLFISCKYEEIYPPHINKFVENAGGTCNKYDILQMESTIVLSLNFKLISCTPLRFLDMKYIQAGLGVELSPYKNLAEFLLLMTLPEYQMCWHRPSTLALTALCLSCSVLQNRRIEPAALGINDGNVSVEEFKHCFGQMLQIYNRRQ